MADKINLSMTVEEIEKLISVLYEREDTQTALKVSSGNDNINMIQDLQKLKDMAEKKDEKTE